MAPSYPKEGSEPYYKGYAIHDAQGTVLVDVAVDQGGCIETCKPTTHEDPTYIIDDIVHYCVANMPGAVPYTSTIALTNATLPYVIALANNGWKEACSKRKDLLKDLMLFRASSL